MTLDTLLPPAERRRRALFHALGLPRPVTMPVHPRALVAQRIARTLPALLEEARMQDAATRRARSIVLATLADMDAEVRARAEMGR